MSTIDTSANLLVNLSWNQSDEDADNPGNAYNDAGVYIYNKTWQSGSVDGVPDGYSPAGQVWHNQCTLAANSSTGYSMTGLPKTSFGVTSYLNMSNVRAIYIENLYTGTGGDIVIKATGANGFSGLFRGGSGNLTIGASSPFLLANYLTGWAVGATNNTFTLSDINGSGCSVRVAILGI